VHYFDSLNFLPGFRTISAGTGTLPVAQIPVTNFGTLDKGSKIFWLFQSLSDPVLVKLNGTGVTLFTEMGG
jgi:hypothetical protein